MMTRIELQAEVPEEMAGNRLDQVAAKLFPDYSRARLQSWIREGHLLVNTRVLRARDKVYSRDILEIAADLQSDDSYAAEPLPLQVVYEDDALLVINKPVGTVVHPAAGHRQGTLLNGLLHHCKALEMVPRAGIVHRLDKDTTGLMVVAKTLSSHTSLVRQLQQHEVYREYEAVVNGVLTAGGRIDWPLGRHPVNRKKRAVIDNGKAAVTHYTVIKRFPAHTHVRVKLETGRTHQIRVHFSHLQYPLVGDKTYGGRLRIPRGCSDALAGELRRFSRQALHARSLGLIHPQSGEFLNWSSELPVDMQGLLATLDAEIKCQQKN